MSPKVIVFVSILVIRTSLVSILCLWYYWNPCGSCFLVLRSRWPFFHSRRVNSASTSTRSIIAVRIGDCHSSNIASPPMRDSLKCFCEAVMLCDSRVQPTSHEEIKRKRNIHDFSKAVTNATLKHVQAYRTEVRMRKAISRDPSSRWRRKLLTFHLCSILNKRCSSFHVALHQEKESGFEKQLSRVI